MRINQILILAILIGAFTQAEALSEEKSALVLCKNNQVVRTIRVNSSDDGCRTVYTKAGVDRVVGSGQNTSSCVQFLNNIKGNLEEAAWSCREVSKFKVTDLSKAPASE